MALGPIFGVLFDGLAYGMLLFLLSVGLSVTLGMMNFVNLAHCAFAMLGGYTTVTLMNVYGWPFLATLPLAFLAAAVGQRRLRAHALPAALPRQRARPGAADDRARLRVGGGRRLRVRHHPAADPDAAVSARLDRLSSASASAPIGCFSSSRGLSITLLLALTLEYTRFGAQVRAAVDNQRMARGLGINVDAAFAITFALGSGLAGLGGALAIEIVGLDPAFAFTYLVYVLIVVAVGGLGSIGGSFAAAILLGITDIAGKYYVPEVGAFLIYLAMVVLLMWRPAGLFGRR